jgi:hypothetical protein
MMEAISAICANNHATTLKLAVNQEWKKGMIHQSYALNV